MENNSEGEDDMRRRGLIILTLSAALTVGSGIVSLAAAGWATENGKWVYYDSNGSFVTNEWKKGADDQWRYLNDYGEMAISCWVDDTYYVDANGIMVSGRWLQLSYGNGGRAEGTNWYYFNDNGKAVISAWKKIDNRWYHFDADGAMETGWIEDNMYYMGAGGAAVIGWNKLYPPEGEEENSDPFDDDEGKKWYYFNSSGKKFVPTEANNGYGEKRIDGTYYCFNMNGAMQTGWVNIGGDDTIAGYRYYGKDGKAITGWYSEEAPRGLSGASDDVDWYYFSSKGVPKCGPEPGEATASDLTRINNKTYLFNSVGNPVYGLQKVYTNKDKTEATAYYFEENTRTARTGRTTIREEDGNTATYYFQTNGKGYTGVKDGTLYYMGKQQKADAGTRYQPISLPDGKTYLVNTSGKITKSTSGVKDADGIKYTTNSQGILMKVNDETVSEGYGRPPEEPVWR